tara:strand:- start:494 stop:721 length:228 start_codon:yes stop_codon:yes gene_type:complete
MEESDYSYTPIFIIFLLFCILMVCHHQAELDEYGRDSYDISRGIAGRDRWGYIIHEDGSHHFWANIFDMNPYYSW